MFGRNKVAERPVPPSDPSERDFDKVDFHIQRFKDAIEQCQKGETRLAELRRNLRYWETVKCLHEIRRP
jgi:hypothetical protein